MEKLKWVRVPGMKRTVEQVRKHKTVTHVLTHEAVDTSLYDGEALRRIRRTKLNHNGEPRR